MNFYSCWDPENLRNLRSTNLRIPEDNFIMLQQIYPVEGTPGSNWMESWVGPLSRSGALYNIQKSECGHPVVFVLNNLFYIHFSQHDNKRLQVLFIATSFDSTESSSGYDLEPYVFTRYSRAFWDPKMRVNTL